MVRFTMLRRLSVLALAGLLMQAWPVAAQGGGQSLGTVQVTRKVLADGKPLAAGTYTLRLASDAAAAVVGQTTEESRWVEFVQGSQVKGRDVATVLTNATAKTVMNGTKPAAGTSKTELLRGGDYLRVWLNHAGTQYVLHLAVPK